MRALLCLWMVLWTTQVSAQTWRELEVVLLPGAFYQPLSDRLFKEDRPHDLSESALLEHLQTQLAQYDLVKPQALQTLADNLSVDLHRTLTLAQERFDMGLSAWKALNPQDAVTHFERARELHREAFSDLLAPHLLAEVELYRGLALLDLGEQGLAHFAFAQSLFYAPEQRFQPGYYESSVEERLQAAALELQRITDVLSIRFSGERLSALGKALKRDYILVHARLQQKNETLLQVGLFDVRHASFAFRVQSKTPEAIPKELDYALSAWHTCALEVSRALVRKRESAPWSIELGYAHHVWLHHSPTRNFLQGPGVVLGINHRFNSNLEFWAAYRQRVTLMDGNTDLLDVFTSGHLSTGLGLMVGPEVLRLSLRLGLELALSHADITATTDVDCKFFGPSHPRCGTTFQANNPAVWFGLEVGLRLRYMPVRSWYVSFDIGMNSYLLSQSLSSKLNFPLHTSIKLGIPF